MSTQFITNQERLLSDVVNKILPSSERLYFLVGYFYFSGFEEIFKNVKDKEMRILVGLEVEKALQNKVIEFEAILKENRSRGEIREDFWRKFVDIFNDTDLFDSLTKQESFELFLSKIQNGTLEIRKSDQPNHAKLYIFENKKEFSQGGEFPGTVITGSSNLSRAGMRNNFEINVLSRDKAAYKDALHLFDAQWDTAIPVADKPHMEEFTSKVLNKIWLNQHPKPYLLYLRVLEEYFSVVENGGTKLPSDITKDKYLNLKYQIDAINRGLQILNRHNGVIIADVVGLGKSIIASAIAHNLDLPTIVITPPHLKDQWEDYHNEFRFHAKIYTSGKIGTALEKNDDGAQKLIIIDEAHKYRNELTDDYADLHKLCQGNKVMLLSATPFNNRPQDVFSMVKLFQLPARSTLHTVDNLSDQFRKLVLQYKRIKEDQKKRPIGDSGIKSQVRSVADSIRNILTPLVIRRSRLDLEAIEEYKKDLKQQKISFPTVNSPELLEYDLGPLSELYADTLEAISSSEEEKGFIGARYKPTSYIKDIESYRERIAKELGIDENLLKQSQSNLADFMRRLLVYRFESSILAFKKTLETLINHCIQIKEWHDKFGKIPLYKKGNLPLVEDLIESVGEEQDDGIKAIAFEEELKGHIEKGLRFIEKEELRPSFIKDVEKDIKLLKDIHEKWFRNGLPKDPKLEHFEAIIKRLLKEDPKRKVVVFTQYSDTADHLYDNLKTKLRAFKYSANDASTTAKQTIKENFDAGNRVQKDDYDVLIATDAISEGFNLHRAGTIFNYDIPYNPTRVIQRVGRINRINIKMFDELFIYNFFPTATGEKEIRVKQISTLKIDMVHALFGEDTKVLTNDEELESYFAKQFRDALMNEEELSPLAKHEDLIKNVRAAHKDELGKAMSISRRSRVRRKGKKNGVIIFGKKGEECVFKYSDKPNEGVSISSIDALNMFEASKDEEGIAPSKEFYPIYELLKTKLFVGRTEVAIDRGKEEAIRKAEAILVKIPQDSDYWKDLLTVLKDLDSLPDQYAKMIRAIKLESFENDIKEFKNEVPHSYLIKILEKERNIDQGKESLILSEEMA